MELETEREMKQPPTSRYRLRRLLQFRLRTLLVLLLVSSIALGWWRHHMQSYYEQQEAITEVAWYAQHMAFEPGKPAWLRPFADEKVFQDIVHLSFQSQGKMSDEQMMHLAKMPRLRRLSLQHTSVTDQGVSHLSKLHELDTLSLESTLVTDKGLKHLSDLPMLRTLQLNHTEVTGKGLQHLSGMKSLQRFEIDSAHVSDDDLRWLVELPRLKQLEMHTIGLEEAGFSQLSALRQLESLELHCARVPFESTVNVQVEHFAKLKSLTLRSNKYDHLVVNDLPQLTHSSLYLRSVFGRCHDRSTSSCREVLLHSAQAVERGVSPGQPASEFASARPRGRYEFGRFVAASSQLKVDPLP